MRWAALILLLALAATARAGGSYGHHHHHHHGYYGHGHHGGYYGGHCRGRYGCHGSSPAPPHGTNEPSNPPSHPSTSCGRETAALELAYEEFDSTAFEAGVGRFSLGLADVADIRMRCIGVERNPARRRSLLADAPIVVTFSLLSDDSTAVALALAAAARDGTLDELLDLLGGRLSGFTIVDGQGNAVYSKISSVTTRTLESPAPAPSAESPAGAPSAEELDAIPATLESMPWGAAETPLQAPAESTTATTAAIPKKKSHLGAILGGAIGGGVGGLAVLAAAAYFLLRKKGASSSSSYAVGNPTYAPQPGNTATVTLAGAAAPKGGPAKAELEEVVEQTGTPRSARRRAVTPFQNDEGSS